MEKDFKEAILGKNKVKLTFYSKEDSSLIERTCAPLDFGPSRRSYSESGRYHLWDYDSDQGPHVLSLLPEQIKKIEVLSETFDPADFITWDVKKSPWFIDRDWGIYS